MIRVIFLGLFIFKIFVVDFINAKECVSPYKENATCIPLAKCDVILSVLYTLTPRAVQFVKDSQCGCDAEMVCCGSPNDKPYPQLKNCAPVQSIVIAISPDSDRSICGLDSSTDRILGGGPTTAEEFPWLAALEYRNKFSKENEGIRCGGSIITKRFILTAAHCIWHAEFEIIKVWLGVSNITSEETCSNTNGNISCIKSVKKINVKKTITHEFYNSIYKLNDIGLLQLEADIQYTKYIRPVCLPSKWSDLPSIGTYFTVCGWGFTENGTKSDVKLKVQLPFKENKVCEDYLNKRFQNITSKQLCVGGERGLDACEGDSGGPLMYDFIGANNDVQWIQLGIVSYGTGCGVQDRPGVYVKISSYHDWIYYKINNRTARLAAGEPCRFQDGTIGTCVHLNTCPEFYKRIVTESEYYNFMQFRQCDTLFSSLICCKQPSSMITADCKTISVLPDKTTCGIDNEEPEIDDETRFPWIAGIDYSTEKENRSKIRCLGTVIHSRYIITAVDCVSGKKSQPTYVWLGRWNSSPDYSISNPSNCGSNAIIQKIGINKIIPNPLLRTTYPYVGGINALLLLKNEIQFSDNISPICLDLSNVPKIEPEAVITVWLKNFSTTDLITSSDQIMKVEFSSLNCLGRECTATGSTDLNCELPEEALGIPIMRRYEDQENGRMQWYLVSVDILAHSTCDKISYRPSTMNSLNQIISIISAYS